MRAARVNNLGAKVDTNNKRLIQEAPRQRAAMKIRKIFLDGVRYDISKRDDVHRKAFKDKAFKGKVLEITVEPKYVGTRAAYQVPYLIMKAYQAMIKQLPPNANFLFQGQFTFRSEKHGDDSFKHSKVYKKKDAATWATAFADEIYTLAQSEEKIKFKSFLVHFYIALIPSGGCFVNDETLNEILSRKTVIQIRNNDNNCFWYSLAYSINDNRKTRVRYKFVEGKPSAAVKTDASNISLKCGIPFDTPVSLTELEAIEDKLNCNIYVLNIRDLPLHRTETHLYNGLLYYSENKETQNIGCYLTK
jgi:hypothetical protein